MTMLAMLLIDRTWWDWFWGIYQYVIVGAEG